MATPNPPSLNVPKTSLPLVVQVGFAGTRNLYDTATHPDVNAVAFEKGVQDQFETILRKQLDLLLEKSRSREPEPPLFWCGISAIAVGGDTIFTRACLAQDRLQRVFLPQSIDDFLTAAGSHGPDFTTAQQATARTLLNSPNVIQRRVVSDAHDRRDRFHDVNLKIVRAADVLVCLVRADQIGKSGSSIEIKELGARRKLPVLVIRITVVNNAPVLDFEWFDFAKFRRPRHVGVIKAATMPAKSLPIPEIGTYAEALKAGGSGHANRSRKHFRIFAFVIIGTHVVATILAVLALKLTNEAVAYLLGIEAVLLFFGFGVHQFLHHTHRVRRWALSRLAAEVARSVSSVGPSHIDLKYLYALPFPVALRPLLNTINVLHLRSTIAHRADPWKVVGEKKRSDYVHKRLESTERKKKGQILYNEETRDSSDCRLVAARYTFFIASSAALFATFFKMLIVCEWIPLTREGHDLIKPFLGFCAIVLPVIAVASLSLAAAFDLEARHANAEEMVEFLKEQVTLLKYAASTREYSRLLIETETRLLGETVNWYARRSFIGVS